MGLERGQRYLRQNSKTCEDWPRCLCRSPSDNLKGCDYRRPCGCRGGSSCHQRRANRACGGRKSGAKFPIQGKCLVFSGLMSDPENTEAICLVQRSLVLV